MIHRYNYPFVISSLILFLESNCQLSPLGQARWCTINSFERMKCDDMVAAIKARVALNQTYPPNYLGKKYNELPQISCVDGTSQFDCMDKINTKLADLMTLETALSFTAGEYYNMMPLVAEKYEPGIGDEGLDFYAVVVVKASDTTINLRNLKGKKACMPGVGQAAGWVYPVSFLIEKKFMEIVQCNVPVKSAAAYFGDMCAPDGLARYYNPFGNNPATICKTCKGRNSDYCSVNDPYAGYNGAMNCLMDGSDVAFVRHTTINNFLNLYNTGNVTDKLTTGNFQLLCQDGSRVAADQYLLCNWGRIASHVVTTSAMYNADFRSDLTDLLSLLSMDFGVGGMNANLFQLFQSVSYGKSNLLFSDVAQTLKDIRSVAGGTRTTYYTWTVMTDLIPTHQDLKSRMVVLNSCQLQQARWCVISPYEMLKCEQMIMAFMARNLKPDLYCVQGDSAVDCMKKIKNGDADLITLDAADVYTGGKRFGLVPIASEDYSGGESQGYYAVAIARKRYSYMLLTNLKQQRSCHPGVYTAVGWVVPINVLIQTGQINIQDCNTYLAVGQYFSKSCVPGVLDSFFNPFRTNPINLCEACSTAGPRRCMRSDEELYYGASGAFRCLVEVGGDIAFARHYTVLENTGGRNIADWARNRRSDDYELLCYDGRREAIENYARCNLGHMPANAVVTSGFKSEKDREIYWSLLSYAQLFFDSDQNSDFFMFDSYLNHKDLLFQDATVRLIPINQTQQNYANYLGPLFVRNLAALKNLDCVTRSNAPTFEGRWITLVFSFMLLLNHFIRFDF